MLLLASLLYNFSSAAHKTCDKVSGNNHEFMQVLLCTLLKLQHKLNVCL